MTSASKKVKWGDTVKGEVTFQIRCPKEGHSEEGILEHYAELTRASQERVQVQRHIENETCCIKGTERNIKEHRVECR